MIYGASSEYPPTPNSSSYPTSADPPRRGHELCVKEQLRRVDYTVTLAILGSCSGEENVRGIAQASIMRFALFLSCLASTVCGGAGFMCAGGGNGRCAVGTGGSRSVVGVRQAVPVPAASQAYGGMFMRYCCVLVCNTLEPADKSGGSYNTKLNCSCVTCRHLGAAGLFFGDGSGSCSRKYYICSAVQRG